MIIVDSNGTGLDLEDLDAGRRHQHRANLRAFLLLLSTNLVEDMCYLVVIGCLSIAIAWADAPSVAF